MARISKRIVDGAKPGRKRFFVWDDRLPGFGLLVLPTGLRSYVYQYRTTEGRSRRATIGKHGALTAEQARTLAEGMARKVNDGGDPLKDKDDARNALTVGGLIDRYLASAAFASKAVITQRNGRGELERHVRPLVGRRTVAGLQPDDIRKLHADIVRGKTAGAFKTGARGLARVRGGEGAARHTCRLFRAVCRWAIAEKLIDRDPTAGVAFGRDGERDATLDERQYAALFSTLAKMERERRLPPAVADAVRIIAMTGARRGEVIGLRWDDVELKAGRLVLTRHKTARSTGKPRVINLPSAAREIIARQPAGRPGDFVFRASKDGVALSVAKAWRTVRREAGLPDNVGLHTLRHSLASSLAVSGAAAPEIMTVLGHRQLSTVAKYLHFADDARAVLAERAAAPALAGMAAAAGSPKAAVVALPKGRKR